MKECKRNAINKYFFSRKFKKWNIYFRPLVLAGLELYRGDNGHKIQTASKHLFQRTQQHGDCTKPLVMLNLYKKQYLPVITWTKRYSSKQVLSMIYTLGKGVFGAATFKGL